MSSNVVLVLYALFNFTFLLGYRVIVKYGFELIRSYRKSKKTVVIYGAGETGIATKRVLMHDARTGFYVAAFIDDDRKKSSKSLDGVSIISFDQFKEMVTIASIDEVVISSFALSPQRKNELVDFCLDHDINVLTVPPYNQWADGGFIPTQLKQIKIEDLLERDPIVLDNDQIRKQIRGKRILVTGAAGSIGSEIVRQLASFSPEMIILCDQAETPLHDLELEMRESAHNVQYIPFLTSVNHRPRMEALFEKFKPHHVYHAAAYKHVPMMEFNPMESVKVNVLGTQQVADLSVKYGVDRFVMVSTDKAVNPTNVMGASKRLAEMYVQGLSAEKNHHTRFITTRFGNVLGSNGSVILRFKDQIEKGGPVTVTHPNITRFFMTIPEACQLVLEAGSMGNGGEVFVFDMGSPVKIADLAKKMIRLYGMIPNIDINITYSGLRPGEKLYEELLTDGENTIKTYHDKIMIAKVREVDFSEINTFFNQFSDFVSLNCEESVLVSKMKAIVPEYISNNSIFERLDASLQAKILDMTGGGG
jgi:FlaA1/EpsC-like NDP-sugar epimerase